MNTVGGISGAGNVSGKLRSNLTSPRWHLLYGG
jgi:hypothetical protein